MAKSSLPTNEITYSYTTPPIIECIEEELPSGSYRGKVRGFSSVLVLVTSTSLVFFDIPGGPMVCNRTFGPQYTEKVRVRPVNMRIQVEDYAHEITS